VIIACDLDVAREYGRLKHRLKAKGRPLPENDVWIAAAAIRYGLVVVARDGHFREVEDVVTIDWAFGPFSPGVADAAAAREPVIETSLNRDRSHSSRTMRALQPPIPRARKRNKYSEK
jgi:hypothetical protein